MRVLVTGSRNWTDRARVYNALRYLCEIQGLMYEPDEHGNTMPDPSRITVVHGACPTGADFYADEWCLSNDFLAETHPADWARYGKRAGYIRNDEMVMTEPDLCLAFIKNNSPGATMTADLAEKHGIKTVRFTE